MNFLSLVLSLHLSGCSSQARGSCSETLVLDFVNMSVRAEEDNILKLYQGQLQPEKALHVLISMSLSLISTKAMFETQSSLYLTIINMASLQLDAENSTTSSRPKWSDMKTKILL